MPIRRGLEIRQSPRGEHGQSAEVDFGRERMFVTSNMKSNRPGMRTRNLLFAALALLLLVVLAWGSGWGAWSHARDIQRLFASLRGDGLAGPLWCITLQALQVVFFFVPGEVLSFAAGYVFGTWHALVYSVAGVTLGSAFNFYLARALGRQALARVINPSRLERVDRLLAGNRGRLAVFTLFLIPIGPKDALCYGAAFSGMSLPEFAAISGVARVPGLLCSICLGARVASHNSVFLILVGLTAMAIFGAFYLFRHYKTTNNAADRHSGKPSLTP